MKKPRRKDIFGIFTYLLESELQRRFKLAEAGKPIPATTLSEQKGAILQECWGDTVAIEDDGPRACRRSGTIATSLVGL